jgi:hypothetical protein
MVFPCQQSWREHSRPQVDGLGFIGEILIPDFPQKHQPEIQLDIDGDYPGRR